MSYIAYIAAAGGGGGILHIFDEKNQSVSPVPPTTLPDPPAQAHTDLMALLTVSGEEDFESYTNGHLFDVDITSLSVNGISAAISVDPPGASGLGLIGQIEISTANGRYNTTPISGGTKYWKFDAFVDEGAPTYVYAILTFSTPIAAFWFYATDAGDFDATLEVTMHKTGGGTDVYVPDMPAGAADGALNFFGIVDDRGTVTYDAVWIRRTNSTDVIGLDGMGWATAAQIA